MTNALARAAAAAVLAATAAAACAPVRDTHGFTSTGPGDIEVKVGEDTKQSVLTRLGSPSTQSAFDSTAWYYVTSIDERFAFYMPKTVRREITVVRFGEDERVASVDKFGLERGRVVAYNSAETPTRGRELSLIEQLLGGVGAAAPIFDEEANRPNRR